MKKSILKRKNVFFILLLLVIMILVNRTTTYAYEIIFGTCNFTTNKYKLKYKYSVNGNVDYKHTVKQAINAWNNSGARINLSEGTPKNDINIHIKSEDHGNTGWHGLTGPPIFILMENYSGIFINDYYYHSGFYNHSSELIAHEMGHSFRLNDVEDTSVLMRSSGYKGSPYPEQDDIDGVNSNY